MEARTKHKLDLSIFDNVNLIYLTIDVIAE